MHDFIETPHNINILVNCGFKCSNKNDRGQKNLEQACLIELLQIHTHNSKFFLETRYCMQLNLTPNTNAVRMAAGKSGELKLDDCPVGPLETLGATSLVSVTKVVLKMWFSSAAMPKSAGNVICK